MERWWLLDLPDHRGVALTVKDLNAVYKDTPASQDVDAAGSRGSTPTTPAATSSFLRFATDGSAAYVSNIAGMPHDGYRIGLPWAGTWPEVLNTDAEAYLGSGVGNLGGVTATAESWHGQPPRPRCGGRPLGTVWLHSPGPGA